MFDKVYILFHFNSSTSINFIQEYGIITLSIISTVFIFMAATVYLKHFIFKAVFLKLDVLVLYAAVLCLPEDGHLSTKHAGESMCMDNL